MYSNLGSRMKIYKRQTESKAMQMNTHTKKTYFSFPIPSNWNRTTSLSVVLLNIPLAMSLSYQLKCVFFQRVVCWNNSLQILLPVGSLFQKRVSCSGTLRSLSGRWCTATMASASCLATTEQKSCTRAALASMSGHTGT